MNNIQLATTLVAPTGTGYLFVPFDGGSNSSTLKQSGAASNPAVLRFNRQLPKPTKDFPGVERGEVRLVEYYATGTGAIRQMTASINTSIPVDIPLANRQAFHTRCALVARDPTVLAMFESSIIPV